MKKYLLLFTISPVQTFIAQARKTQDLYAGSQILSDLMKFVYKELENDKAEIIFPQLLNTMDSATHRILAKITNAEICEKLEKSVKRKFIEISKESNIIENNISICEEQLNDFLQVYWVAKEIDNRDFTEQYKEIESLLGAVKNVRIFKQLNNGLGETGRKCSLCGERNVKFYRKNETETKRIDDHIINSKLYDKKVLITHNNSIDPIKLSELDEGEGICAVCAVKRFRNKSFPSTAEIATLDCYNSFEQTNNSQAMGAFSFINKTNAQLLYKENREGNLLAKVLKQTNSQITESYLFEQLEIIDKVTSKNNIRLKKYYALLQFDGDSMGKLMSGDFLEDKSDLLTFQKTVSELLSHFAKFATKYLIAPKGRAIYAGGDDFLGFVNLHYLFDVLAELRKQFDCIVNKKIQETYPLTHDFTFSAGIAIAHYKTPLHAVLEYTRKMEKRAKKVDGKDALAISVLKHSGEIQETVLKWENGKNAILMGEIIEELVKENFSSTFIKNMYSEFSRLIDDDGETNISTEIIETELYRLILRAVNHNLKYEKEESKKLVEKILALYEDNKLKDLLSLLNICDFIVRKTS